MGNKELIEELREQARRQEANCNRLNSLLLTRAAEALTAQESAPPDAALADRIVERFESLPEDFIDLMGESWEGAKAVILRIVREESAAPPITADDLVPGAVMVTPDGRVWKPVNGWLQIIGTHGAGPQGVDGGWVPIDGMLPFQRGFTVRKEGE